MGDLKLWSQVDKYYSELFGSPNDTLNEIKNRNKKSDLPDIAISENQGKFLQILIRLISAKRILEIGTLGGYSSVCMAQALPSDGMLITLELEEEYAQLARDNIEYAGLRDVVQVHQGLALESLETLCDENEAPFDLIFIDADKPNNKNYLAWCLRLSRPGTLIIADNVVRAGDILDENAEDLSAQGIRDFNIALKQQKGIDCAMLQTVGNKGYDGMSFILVEEKND